MVAVARQEGQIVVLDSGNMLALTFRCLCRDMATKRTSWPVISFSSYQGAPHVVLTGPTFSFVAESPPETLTTNNSLGGQTAHSSWSYMQRLTCHNHLAIPVLPTAEAWTVLGLSWPKD